MKMNVFFSMLALLLCRQGIADDQHAWGPVTNNIQMSIRAKSSVGTITTNESVKMVICYRNISTNEVFVTYVANGIVCDPSFSLSVIAPSGKDISPDLTKYASESGRFMSIGPKQLAEVEFSLSSVCDLSESGTYRITLKKQMLTPEKHTPYSIVSNTLLLRIVLGK